MFSCFKTARRLALAALVTVSLPAMLAADIYVEFTNPVSPATAITGESQTVGFLDQIIATSVTSGASNSVGFTSKGPTAGKVSLSEIHITKFVDRASPGLFRATAAGGLYGRVNISFTKTQQGGANPGSQVAYYKIELNDVFVSSVSISGSDGNEQPTETLTLNYSAIRYTYIPFNQAGQPGQAIVSQWNQVTNREEFRNKDASISDPVPAGSKPASTGTEITVE
jgi:type VI secretion system secreted protein Hcp